MWRHRRYIVGYFLVMLSLLVASCGPVAAPTPAPETKAPLSKSETTAPKPTLAPGAPSPSPKPAAEQPQYGGTLYLATTSEMPSLDVHREQTNVVLKCVGSAYNGLVKWHPVTQAEIVPDMVNRWEISKDGLTYTFNFPDAVKFHDGSPFTTEDAKFSLERNRWPERREWAPRSSLIEAIDKVEAPDRNTLILKLSRPSAPLLSVLANGWMLVVSKRLLEQNPRALAKSAMGTGPFKFKRYETGSLVELERNQEYFKKGLPYLDRVVRYIIVDGATRQAAFRTGRVLAADGVWKNYPEQRQAVEKAIPGVRFSSFAVPSYIGPIFNVHRKPLDDPRVRLALRLASSAEDAIRVIYRGDGVVCGPLTGEWDIPREELLQMPGYRKPKDQDLAEARRLVKEAGAEGVVLDGIARITEAVPESAVFFKETVKQVGMDLNVRILETTAEYEARRRGDFHAARWRTGLTDGDPSIVFGECWVKGGGQNFGNYYSEEFQTLFEMQDKTLDSVKRKEIVRQMSRILLADNPGLFWGYLTYTTMTWPQLRNFLEGKTIYSNCQLEVVWLAK